VLLVGKVQYVVRTAPHCFSGIYSSSLFLSVPKYNTKSYFSSQYPSTHRITIVLSFFSRLFLLVIVVFRLIIDC